MKVKEIIDEVFQDYKKPAMMIAMCKCDWKCLKEQGLDISLCQNYELRNGKNIDISISSIINRYINNEITKAIVINGLEPFLQFDEFLELIKEFGKVTNDDIVIYTGYYPEELTKELAILNKYKNIIVKFGRYIPNRNKKYDDILGVELISDNQFALKIS
jgi:pyruvate-formate lyase-activating enzyme